MPVHHSRSSSLESAPSLDGRVRKGQLQVDLNMANMTVVSGYDDHSRWVGSSALSLPPDVHEERERERHQQQKPEQKHQRESSSKSADKLSQQVQNDQDSRQSPSQSKESTRKSVSKYDPLRHFRLVVLSNVFFLIGSILFTAASWLEYQEPSSNHRSSALITEERVPDYDEQPSGYHLKISTSIDTYVTNQMICMVAAAFCFLQVGFINVVRTPLDKFHFFQIMAGLSGLVSSMFWETKTILSDISYFFFVHAMTGQALLQLHSHWRRLVRPAMVELNSQSQIDEVQEHPINRSRRRFTLSPVRQQAGHYAFVDSADNFIRSQTLSGLMSDERSAPAALGESYSNSELSSSDGGYSFSIENSYSLEDRDSISNEHCEQCEEQREQVPVPPTEGTRDEESQSEATSVQRSPDGIGTKQDNNEEEFPMVKFGILFCVADSIFVLGALVETALTYLTILVLSEQSDDDGDSVWYSIARNLNLVPGILWLGCAVLTFLTTLWMRKRCNAAAKQ